MAAILDIICRTNNSIDPSAIEHAITLAISAAIPRASVTATLELLDDPSTSLRLQSSISQQNRDIETLARNLK